MTVDLQSPTHVSLAPLVFRRWPGRVLRPPRLQGTLGGRAVGAGTGLFEHELLAPGGAVADLWSGAAEAHTQRHGCVQYSSDGQWLHGHAELDDASAGRRAARGCAPGLCRPLRGARIEPQPAPVAPVELHVPHQRPRRRRRGALPPLQRRPTAGLHRRAPQRFRRHAGGLRARHGRRPAAGVFPGRPAGTAGDREPAPDQRLPLPGDLRCAQPHVFARRARRCRRWPPGAVHLGHRQHRRPRHFAPRRRAPADRREPGQHGRRARGRGVARRCRRSMRRR